MLSVKLNLKDVKLPRSTGIIQVRRPAAVSISFGGLEPTPLTASLYRSALAERRSVLRVVCPAHRGCSVSMARLKGVAVRNRKIRSRISQSCLAIDSQRSKNLALRETPKRTP